MKHKSLNVIKNALENNKLSHAYLYYGDNGVDVETLVFNSIKIILEYFGKKINANNFSELNY